MTMTMTVLPGTTGNRLFRSIYLLALWMTRCVSLDPVVPDDLKQQPQQPAKGSGSGYENNSGRPQQLRQLRERYSYSQKRQREGRRLQRRAQEDQEDERDSTTVPTDLIFGLSLEEFQGLLTSDVDKEYGYDGNSTDGDEDDEKAERRWQEMADVQLDFAVEAEELYWQTRSNRSDAEYPFLLCNKIAGLSGRERMLSIVDTVTEEAANNTDDGGPAGSDAMFDETKMHTVYNGANQTCFLVRFLASSALRFAQIRNGSYPILPVSMYMKIRKGSVEMVIRRAMGALARANLTAEISPNHEAFVAESDTPALENDRNRLEVSLCSGQNDDDLSRIGDRLLHFMRHGPSDRSSFARSTIYANLSEAEIQRLPARVRFWMTVYENGINGPDGCNEMLDRLVFQVARGQRTPGEAVGFYVSLAPPGVDSNLTTSAACFLSLMAGMSLLPQVCSIDVNREFTTDNHDATWILQDPHSGGVPGKSSRPFWDAGVTGKGQVVGVSDTGLDTDNCYVWDSTGDIRKDGTTDLSRRKVVVYDDYVDRFDVESGHGTHVVGTIVGHKAVDGRNETNEARANGVALDAKVAFFDASDGGSSLSIPADRSRYLNVGRDAGARIHSSSWGCQLIPYVYDSLARDTDLYLFNDWTFLHVVAAGNSGSGNSEQTIGSPGAAKNVLTVGSSQNPNQRGIEYLSDFSSRGPCPDGRICPHVVAPGQWILSMNAIPTEIGECDPDGGTASSSIGTDFAAGLLYLQGTSMATPATSGAAALVRQYFLDGHFPRADGNVSSKVDPSAMLVKAVLINGARELQFVDNGAVSLPTSYYDKHQGFGRVSLIDSLPLEGHNKLNASYIDRATIRDGETINLQANISGAGGCDTPEFRVTLVWADPPGATGCVHCLVNDLDLSVTKNGNPDSVYYPNGRTDTPDRDNNVERIILPVSHGDAIDIQVKANNLDRAEQPFALVMTGCFGARSYVGEGQGEAQPEGQGMSDRTKTIIIAVFSVLGGILVIGIGCYFIQGYVRDKES